MDLSLRDGEGQITLNWRWQRWWEEAEEGLDFKEYRYSLREGDGAWSDWTTIVGATDDTFSHTITGLTLTKGTRYTVALLRVLQDESAEPVYGPFQTRAVMPNNRAEGRPVIAGTAQVGETITVDTSGISDADGMDNPTFSYRWFGQTDWSIREVRESSYTLVPADEGKSIYVEVRFTDGVGIEEVLSSERITVAAGTPPEVTNVAVTSTPASGDTYGLGETIRVTLTFNEAVSIWGRDESPRLKIKLDPSSGERWAVAKSGEGTTELTFAYEVAESDISTQGIAVLANTLKLVHDPGSLYPPPSCPRPRILKQTCRTWGWPTTPTTRSARPGQRPRLK